MKIRIVVCLTWVYSSAFSRNYVQSFKKIYAWGKSGSSGVSYVKQQKYLNLWFNFGSFFLLMLENCVQNKSESL